MEQKTTYNTYTNDEGQLAYTFKGGDSSLSS